MIQPPGLVKERILYMAELEGNLMVAQSGGPTSVINASLAGVVQEAGKHMCIEEIYGGLNGVHGILREELIDFNEETNRVIDGLKRSPAAALGTCRYKIDAKKDPVQAQKDIERLFSVLQAHNIRYFFYIGGNDSQDTSNKVYQLAHQKNYDIRVIGVPKTIDNDLPHTDHTPGYGSVIKYVGATTLEVATDIGAMATDAGSCCVIEVMGRSAGWIAAGSAVAKKYPDDPPHIVLIPEIPLDETALLNRVKATVQDKGFCIIVVGEGLKNEDGEEIGADKSQLDAFGHPVLAGAGEKISQLIQAKVGVKTRSVKLGYAQRCAAHLASKQDIDEAYACGAYAVKSAVAGNSGFMVKIVRRSSEPYEWTTDLHPLMEIANVERLVPREWMSDDGFTPNEIFMRYIRPLVVGEFPPPYEGGMPSYPRLAKHKVQKRLESLGSA